MNKKILTFHILCCLGVVSAVIVLSFYQVFVNQEYQRISPKNFFLTKTLLKAGQQVGFNVATFHADKKILVDSDIGSAFTFDSTKRGVNISADGVLSVMNMETQENKNISLPKTSSYQLISMLDEKTVIFAIKNQTWQLLSVDLQSAQQTILVHSIQNTSQKLTSISSPSQNYIAFVDCTPWCEIVVFDLQENKEVRRIPAFTDADKKANMREISLDFFDPQNGLIGYHQSTGSQLYVIDFDLNLLQDIRLDNERNTAEYIGYFPETQQLLFSLNEKDNTYKQIALYSANKPSLHLLQKVEPDKEVRILSLANGYSVRGKIFDLDAREVETIPEGKRAVTVY